MVDALIHGIGELRIVEVIADGARASRHRFASGMARVDVWRSGAIDCRETRAVSRVGITSFAEIAGYGRRDTPEPIGATFRGT
jgi:hypothetical protein